jgi:hypothetical protein
MYKNKPLLLTVSLLACLHLIVGVAMAEKKSDLPEPVRNSIETTFPGNTITKIEKEKWKSKIVTEIELITTDGTHYEVFISDEGIIQKIEEEDDWGWFR